LIAEGKVVRLDARIGRQRQEIGAHALSRAAADRGFLRAAFGEAGDDAQRRVGRTVVGDDQAPVRVRLFGDRVQLLGEKRRAVFGAHQDGDVRGIQVRVRRRYRHFVVGRHGPLKPP